MKLSGRARHMPVTLVGYPGVLFDQLVDSEGARVTITQR